MFLGSRIPGVCGICPFFLGEGEKKTQNQKKKGHGIYTLVNIKSREFSDIVSFLQSRSVLLGIKYTCRCSRACSKLPTPGPAPTTDLPRTDTLLHGHGHEACDAGPAAVTHARGAEGEFPLFQLHFVRDFRERVYVHCAAWRDRG